jgi:hypothetical protein
MLNDICRFLSYRSGKRLFGRHASLKSAVESTRTNPVFYKAFLECLSEYFTRSFADISSSFKSTKLSWPSRLLFRNSDGLLWRHTSSKALIKCAGNNSSPLAPFGKSSTVSVDNDYSVATGVTVLLLRKSPSAVIGFIVTVDINSVDTVFGSRFATHVSEKRFVSRPSFTDRYATGAIISVSICVYVMAPTSHATPSTILGGFFTVATLTMRKRINRAMLAATVNTITTATLDRTVAKQIARTDFGVSAIAFTKPQNATLRRNSLPFYYDKTAETFGNHIVEFRHSKI